MQINFKTYERIVKNKTEETEQKYYFDKFTTQKNDMKKTWATIDETLNRKQKSTEYPAEFLMSIFPVLDQAYLRILMCLVKISLMMST